ncbi:unnamed protein product, partial [marine sediment metagenome]
MCAIASLTLYLVSNSLSGTRRRGYILEDKDGKSIKLDLEHLVSDLLREYYFATFV